MVYQASWWKELKLMTTFGNAGCWRGSTGTGAGAGTRHPVWPRQSSGQAAAGSLIQKLQPASCNIGSLPVQCC